MALRLARTSRPRRQGRPIPQPRADLRPADVRLQCQCVVPCDTALQGRARNRLFPCCHRRARCHWNARLRRLATDGLSFAGDQRGQRIPVSRGEAACLDILGKAEIVTEGCPRPRLRRGSRPSMEPRGHHSQVGESLAFEGMAGCNRQRPTYREAIAIGDCASLTTRQKQHGSPLAAWTGRGRSRLSGGRAHEEDLTAENRATRTKSGVDVVVQRLKHERGQPTAHLSVDQGRRPASQKPHNRLIQPAPVMGGQHVDNPAYCPVHAG